MIRRSYIGKSGHCCESMYLKDALNIAQEPSKTARPGSKTASFRGEKREILELATLRFMCIVQMLTLFFNMKLARVE